MAPTCFPRQMTLRHSRQALCLLLSRPSGARGPAAPLGFCSKRVWSTDFSCARAGAGLHWLRARRLRAMAQKAVDDSRAADALREPPFSTTDDRIRCDMILDDRVAGRIDMLQSHLILDEAAQKSTYDALTKWSAALANLSTSFANRVQ